MNNMHLFNNRIHLQTDHSKEHNLLAEVEAKRLFIYWDTAKPTGKRAQDSPYHPCGISDAVVPHAGIQLLRQHGNDFIKAVNQVALKPRVAIKYVIMTHPRLFLDHVNGRWIIGTTKEKIIDMANTGTLEYELIDGEDVYEAGL